MACDIGLHRRFDHQYENQVGYASHCPLWRRNWLTLLPLAVLRLETVFFHLIQYLSIQTIIRYTIFTYSINEFA